MAFLNPAFLSFLALVGVPLLIHLIRRRKLKVVKWAAMEFLRQSQKKQKRRLRIEELILLALRTLIVALAVLAFCRPVLRTGIPLLSQNARVYAVVVLDNSYSMGHQGSDGKSSFERAQDSIQDLLTHVFKEGDFYLIEHGVVYAQKSDPHTEILFIKVPPGNDKVPVDITPDVLKWFGEPIER